MLIFDSAPANRAMMSEDKMMSKSLAWVFIAVRSVGLIVSDSKLEFRSTVTRTAEADNQRGEMR
jgi:hypothetical protein